MYRMQVRTSRCPKRVAKNKQTDRKTNQRVNSACIRVCTENGGISYVSVLTSAIYQQSLQCFHPRFP